MDSDFPQISPIDLSDLLTGDTKAILLDVRSPAEYRSGHIPGARLAPIDQLTSDRLDGLIDPEALLAENPLFLTCHAGQRAEKAAQMLSHAGIAHLVLVRGGTEAWQKAGLPVTRYDVALAGHMPGPRRHEHGQVAQA